MSLLIKPPPSLSPPAHPGDARSISILRRALALALALALVILLALEGGLWKRTEVYRGPFKGEDGNPTIFVPVAKRLWGRCCLAARTDSAEALQQSRLRVWLGDTEYPKPHTGHDRIRLGEPGGFSHWVNELRLTLPEGQANDATASIRVVYPVQIPSRALSLALIAGAALALALVLGRALHPAAILAVLRRRRGLASALLAVGFAATLALELGAYLRTEIIPGPFASDGIGKMLTVPVGRGGQPVPLLGARGDDDDATARSNLRFSVNGQAYTKAHGDHDLIRAGEVGSFSHWGEEVHFALPPGVDNGWNARVTLVYPLQFASPWISVLVLAALGLLWFQVEKPWLMRDGEAPQAPILAAIRKRRRFVSALLAVALVATLALELGAWRRTEVIAGPFASNGADRMLTVRVAREGQPAPFLGARGDNEDATMRSDLRLSVDGQVYTKPHGDHDLIRAGEGGTFSHWHGDVYFALPPGIANGPDARLTLVYPLQFASPWASVIVMVALAALWIVVGNPGLTQGRVATRWPILAALGVTGALLGLTAIYAAVTAVAWAKGWALPSTAAIIGARAGRWLAMAEPHGPELVLGLAAVGTLSAWAARWRGIDQTADTARVLRLLAVAGFPILFAALLFSASAQWAGLWRQGDLSLFGIAGLLPFSDADDYFAEANDIVNDGLFGAVGLRRPMAQTFRSTLMALGGYNYAAMVVVQSLLLALAIFFAARAVARWRGLWAGIAFAGMAYAVGREFSPTTLTEPLGLFWGLCAIPPLVEALRSRSASHALLGTALLTVALFNRMGSMFTIPALLLWVVSCFGATRGAKLRIAAAAIAALLGIVALNSVTAKLYTRDGEVAESNFSYALCGLTIGGAWSDCQQRYKDELSPSEQSQGAVVRLMYRKAYENFVAHPSVFFGHVSDGAVRFVRTVPATLTQGYFPVSQLLASSLPILELIAAVGLVRLLARMPRHEIWFWVLFWPSVIVSAGFVYYDDGRRVMIAIYPVASLFLASGFWAGQSPEATSVRALSPRAWAGALASVTCLLACLVTPWLVHRFFRPPAALPADFAASHSRVEGEQLVFGGSRMTGVLVVADGETLRSDVPTLHLSDFVNIVHQSGIEGYQALVTPQPPAVPFGFVEAPDLVPGEPTDLKFIVPASVMTRKEVPAWRFETTATPPHKPGERSYWLTVTKAAPFSDGAPSGDAAR